MEVGVNRPMPQPPDPKTVLSCYYLVEISQEMLLAGAAEKARAEQDLCPPWLDPTQETALRIYCAMERARREGDLKAAIVAANSNLAAAAVARSKEAPAPCSSAEQRPESQPLSWKGGHTQRSAGDYWVRVELSESEAQETARQWERFSNPPRAT